MRPIVAMLVTVVVLGFVMRMLLPEMDGRAGVVMWVGGIAVGVLSLAQGRLNRGEKG